MLACPLVISQGYCGGIYETYEVIVSSTCKHIMENTQRGTLRCFGEEVYWNWDTMCKTFIDAAVHEQPIVV